MFPFRTLIGCPVQVPHKCRSGVPAVSQISTPTSVHVDPELVHETVPELDDAAAEAVFQEMEDPPVVYPVPPANSVMAEVAVGVFVPSRTFVAVTVT